MKLVNFDNLCKHASILFILCNEHISKLKGHLKMT